MPVRGAQSLVNTLGACGRRPGILALEILWRWSVGIPTLALLWYQGERILASAPLGPTGIADFSLEDPLGAAERAAAAAALLLPPLLATALWLAPLLAILWAIVSAFGRGVVLRRLDPAARFAPATLMGLQMLRSAILAAACLGWFLAIRRAAESTLDRQAPNLVAYSAWVICLSLGIFTLWALTSWVFSIAPLLALLEGGGVFSSVARSLRLGPLAGKLIEVNLVLAIVKLALLVLAMVFSAMPLPFTTSMTGMPLYLWWAAVAALYLAACDFFQVVRLAAFIQFWRLYRAPNGSRSRGAALARPGKP